MNCHYKVTLIFIVLNLFALSNFQATFRQKTLRAYRLQGKCRKHPNTDIVFENLRVVPDKTKLKINMLVNVKRNFEGQYKVKFVLQRCASQESLGTCELLPPIYISDLCAYLTSKTSVFYGLLDYFTPRMSCPGRKGRFNMTEGTLNLEGLKYIPLQLEGYFWKTEGTLLAANDPTAKVLACGMADFQIVYV